MAEYDAARECEKREELGMRFSTNTNRCKCGHARSGHRTGRGCTGRKIRRQWACPDGVPCDCPYYRDTSR